MPEYKLIYGDSRGLAEPIRLLFALAKVEYEDYRISFKPGQPAQSAIPPEIREKLPYGQVPILEFDGQVLGQSTTIARFLARKFGFLGANDLEAARVDEILDAVKDYFEAWRAVFVAKDDEEKKAAALKNAVETATPKFLPAFSRILEKNGDFLVGNSVTLADVTVYHFLYTVERLFQVKVLKDYPVLQAHAKKVESIPEIAQWLEKRPNTEF